MPSLSDHSSASTVKLLNVGESKTGKTGALASLAKAGYRLWILDYDNGLDILAHALRDDPAAMSRVTYASLSDRVSMVKGAPKVERPHAYRDAAAALGEWKAEEFGAADVLVVDTLTTMSDAAFNEALQLAGRLNQRPQLQDYGWLADSITLFIEMITSPNFACNVIVNTHIKFFTGDDETQVAARGLPNARGQKISATVSRYFNTVVLTRSVGSGPGTRRTISTQPQGVVEVATSNPFSVKASYPIETGMASLFADILGHGPELQPTKAQDK